jgi:hypothetical protein
VEEPSNITRNNTIRKVNKRCLKYYKIKKLGEKIINIRKSKWRHYYFYLGIWNDVKIKNKEIQKDVDQRK